MAYIGQQTDQWIVNLKICKPILIVLNKKVPEWTQEEVHPVRELLKDEMLQTREEETPLIALIEVSVVLVVKKAEIGNNKDTPEKQSTLLNLPVS